MQSIHDERNTTYGQAIGPLYEEIKSVFVQVGGFLILRSASLRTRIEMSDRIRDACNTLNVTRAKLDRLKPPRRYARAHTDLVVAAEGLDRVIGEMMTARGARGQTIGIAEQTLARAYAAFKRGTVCELGLHAVDLNCACCSLSA